MNCASREAGLLEPDPPQDGQAEVRTGQIAITQVETAEVDAAKRLAGSDRREYSSPGST